MESKETDKLKRFQGQYIKGDKPKKIKIKGNELQRVNLCTFSHNGRLPNHGGSL
jgi:hypothetical protein